MPPEGSEQKDGMNAADANDLHPTTIAGEASAAIRAALSDISEQSETMLPSTSEDALSRTSETGRPPLAPPATSQQAAAPSTKPAAADPAQQQPTSPRKLSATSHHGRVQSAGEYSFMSALTDASGDNSIPTRDPIKAPRRDRTVSWDQNFFGNSEMQSTFPTATLQPVLQEEALFINDGSKPIAAGNRNRTRTLDLADIKADNPMETEAETAIIAAIEEENRIEGGRHRSDSASVLMPHVPDEGVNMFESNSTSSAKPTSSHASSTRSHEVPPASPRIAGRHRRHRSTVPPEGLPIEESDTLENTLSGLATAMRKIHTETSEQVDRSELNNSHRRLPSRDIGHPAALMEDIPVNNADILVHNANRLLRRHVQKDDSSIGEDSSNEPEELRAQESQDRTMRHIWNIFETKPDLKKTDGDRLYQVEEGSGESASDDSIRSGFGSLTKPHSSAQVVAGDIEEGININEYDGNDKEDPQMPIDALGDRSNTMSFRGPRRVFCGTQKRVKQELEMFTEFLRPKKVSIAVFCKSVLLLLMFLSGVAAILFYLVGNPLVTTDGASISWILLFIARQIVTFSMTQCTQLLIVDFLCLKTRYLVRLFGPTFSLFIVQSKGIPFIISTWAIYDFVMLSGAHALANHWLFWQDLLDLCNANNPSGGIPSSPTNYRILGSALGAGIAISVKRFWVGLYLGRRTFANYGDQLAQVIENMIIISEVAALGRNFERFGGSFSKPIFEKSLAVWSFEDSSVDENSGGQPQSLKRPPGIGQLDRTTSVGNADRVIEEGHRNKFTGTLSPSQRIKVAQLLDHWLEPEIYKKKRDAGASINAILQFRQALTFMDNSFPFSLAFGPAETRETCIESAQKVFERLLLRTPDQDRLPFDTIAVVALNRNGEINQKKMKQLIRIFRPDQDGNLTMLDFVRSCDTIYKSLRLLRASIANAGQIDQAFENMINVAFFILLICIILAANGFNPLALFLSFSSIILAFAFMIGSASSKYFEGILFILVRRPYDIGDRIAISDVNSVASIDGTLTWFVQKVDLFTTTVRYSGTNEVATLANGSLATSRIINWARSEKAVVHIFLKIGVDIPYSRVQVFKKTVENFVKARPREWVALSRFRATRVEADLGFIEYALDLQHRDSWQNLANILMSKADLASFCLEVSKQLDMRYQAPSLPVDLTLNNREEGPNRLRQAHSAQGTSEDGSHNKSKASHARSSSSPDVRAISALFERAQD